MPRAESVRPYVVAKSAQTLDGKVATRNSISKWITCAKSRQFARRKRDSFDAILIGAETAINDNPRLTGVHNKNLKRLIVDSRLRVSSKARVFHGIREGQCIVATTRQASTRKKALLIDKGVEVLLCPQKNQQVDLRVLFHQLKSFGINRLLIEGGPTIIGSALRCNLIDQIHLYIAPVVIGDDQALSSVLGLSPRSIDSAHHLKIIKQQKIDKDILVIADVHRNN